MSDNFPNDHYFSQITEIVKDVNIKTFKPDLGIIDIIDNLLEKETHTGFYIVDLTKIISQYNKWTTNLPRIKPYYAVKCNPDPYILKTLKILGAGFDCASINEIIQVRNLGSPDIIYANPAKSDFDLKYARSRDIDLLTFDCKEDIWGIKRFHEKANLILRIKVDDSGSTCRFNSKFGAKLSCLDEIFRTAKAAELNIVGVSFHVGSGCQKISAYYDAIKRCRAVFDTGKKFGYTMTILDIGGGFPGTDSDNVPRFEDIAFEINKALEEFFNNADFPDESGLRIIGEPGRYFACSSHTLVLCIIKKKKETDDVTGEPIFEYTLSDGVYGSFNCNIFDHATPQIMPFNERDGVTFKSTVFGPTCDSMDTISTNCQLPDLLPGEWVYIENFGAYTSAASSTFNGFEKIACKYIIRL
jgi:ornithine decarboxylase